MISDTLNCHNFGGYTKNITTSSNVNSTDEDKSKCIIVHEFSSQNCSLSKDKSKQSIVNKTLPQNYSADVDKLCSAEVEKSEYTHVPNFNVSNVFECGRNNPDASYERVYMANEGNKNFTDILDNLNGCQDCHGQILSSKNLKEAVLCVM